MKDMISFGNSLKGKTFFNSFTMWPLPTRGGRRKRVSFCALFWLTTRRLACDTHGMQLVPKLAVRDSDTYMLRINDAC